MWEVDLVQVPQNRDPVAGSCERNNEPLFPKQARNMLISWASLSFAKVSYLEWILSRGSWIHCVLSHCTLLFHCDPFALDHIPEVIPSCGFPTKTLIISHLPVRATFPSHIIFLSLRVITILLLFLLFYGMFVKCRLFNSWRSSLSIVRGYIQKFSDWVDNEIYPYNNKHLLRSNTKGYGGKIH
jgi:hypothetical protein